jgi:hypothetical protein
MTDSSSINLSSSSLQSGDMSTFFTASFGEKLNALGRIKDVRGTPPYEALANELEELQLQAVKGGLTCETLLKLTSMEVKARVELLSKWRHDGAVAPTSLKLQDGLNEYADIMAAMYDDVEGTAFVCLAIVQDSGRLRCGEALGGQDNEEQLVEAALPPHVALRAAKRMEVQRKLTKQHDIREMEKKIAAAKAAKSAPAAQLDDPLEATLVSLRQEYEKLMGPSEEAHAAKGAKPRSAAVVDVLERSGGPLGLNDEQLARIAQHLGQPVRKERVGDALSLLLPNTDPSSCDSAALAMEFVRGAMTTKAQSRRHANHGEFARAMGKAIAKARESDPAMAIQLFDHLQQVTSLTMDYSWKVAEEYHWRVMTRVEDGRYDLAQGGDTWTLTLVLNAGSGSKGATSATKKKSTYDKKNAKFCDYHGYSLHATKDCKVSFKQGEKAKNYFASP